MRVMGIEVDGPRLAQWARWVAPERQPVLGEAGRSLPGEAPVTCTPELRDTFELYRVPSRLRLAWLDEPAFLALPRPQRAALVRAQVEHGRARVPTVRAWSTRLGAPVREQADGHRFVWWPSLLDPHRDVVLADFVTNGRRPSRHGEVPPAVWRAAARLVPRARELVGTFPSGSGPNCFGAVMAMAGVPDAEHGGMRREPFEDWLAQRTRSGGEDSQPGTVLVWRAADGAADHAAVCLGGGWAAHKPSQGWMSPTMVLTTAEVKAATRLRGIRLHRYRLEPSPEPAVSGRGRPGSSAARPATP